MKNNKVVLKPQCMKCGKVVPIETNENDVMELNEGKHIQDVMPYLSRNEREILISNFCGECFDNLFESQ